jgi:hypothetical protein
MFLSYKQPIQRKPLPRVGGNAPRFGSSGLRPSTQFTIEVEPDNAIPLLGVHVIRKGTALITGIYRKPTYTGPYLRFISSHPPHVKRGFI